MAMQNLDLEEQEQLAALKGWWKENGGVILGALTAAALAFAGWQGWSWYQRGQTLQASALYDTLAKAVQAGDAKAMRDASGALAESHPRTLYATMGALTAARFYADRNDPKGAKAQLQWVIERSPSEELRDIARLRLAALLLDDKAYDEALALLGAKHGEAFAAQFQALRGDVLAAKGQTAEARSAYLLALEKGGSTDEGWRAALQLRLDALGG